MKQFTQKMLLHGCKTRFVFGDSELTYSFDDSLVRSGGTISYSEIPAFTVCREKKTWWLRYVIVFIVVYCAVTGSHYWHIGDMETFLNVAYSAGMGFLAACLFALLKGSSRITCFIAADPEICVLHNGQENAILDEIARRRIEAIRKKRAHVNFNQTYYEEAEKFKWLREEGIIDEYEYQQARRQIMTLRAKTPMQTKTH